MPLSDTIHRITRIYFCQLGRMGARIVCLLLLSVCACTVMAQFEVRPVQTIFKDNATTVELEYNLSDATCMGGGPNYFRYRIKGSFRSVATYLTFKMDYYDCAGMLYCMQYSIDVGTGSLAKPGIWFTPDNSLFAGKLDQEFYDVRFASTPVHAVTLLKRPASADPQSINGPQSIFYGQQATLTVRGGYLGTKANWVWYQDQCGGRRVGTGESIVVKPTDNASYFVRAEGPANTTNCARLQLNVDKRSSAAQRVIADSNICKGATTQLRVSGGSLGKDASWVWYSNSCGNTRVGTGETINVSPSQSTYYYVRAESPYNTTSCTRILITPYERSQAPETVAAVTDNTICEGGAVTLMALGGKLSADASWKWYAGSCDGPLVGTGSTVQLSPSSTTILYVKGVGYCNATACASLPVYVNTRSVAAQSIDVPGTVYRTRKTLLSVKGGSTGTNASWKWYKGSVAEDNYMGTGSSIYARIRRPATVYVQAEGICGTTSSVSATVTPQKTHRFHSVYGGRSGKFFHIGLGLGLEWMRFSDEASLVRSTRPNETIPALIQIDGLGIKGELAIHPIIKEYLSLGFIGSLSVGTTPRIFKGGKATLNDTTIHEKYGWLKSVVEGELAIGFRRAKLLVKLNRSFQSNNYSKDASGYFNHTLKYDYDHAFNTETVSAGLRLGRYFRKYGKRGNSFDLVYSLTRVFDDKVTAFSMKNYNDLPAWRPGFSLSWWRQSAFKLRVDMSLATTQRELDITSVNFRDAIWGVQLIYNRNWFY